MSEYADVISESRQKVKNMNCFNKICNGFRGLYFVTLAKFFQPEKYKIAKKINSEINK